MINSDSKFDRRVRAQFEHWYSDAQAWPKAVERDSKGAYKYSGAGSAWDAWKASAEAEREFYLENNSE